MRRRRGFNLVGMLGFLLVFTLVGLFTMDLAMQAGRASHWFYGAQMAYSLADAGAKEALARLRRRNSVARAAGEDPFDAIAREILAATSQGVALPEPLELFTSEDLEKVPEGSRHLLETLGEFSPELRAVLTVEDGGPLWEGSLEGLPSDPRERRGVIRLTVTGSLRSASGPAVRRSVVVEQAYKTVNVLPPLLGRFSLFVHGHDGSELNTVRQVVGSGSRASLEAGSPRPLEVISGETVALVEGDELRRSRLAAIEDAGFLDRQGWIYLGGPNTWSLNLAHGWGDLGESPLLPGYRYPEPGGKEIVDRYALESRRFGRCQFTAPGETDELYVFHHGWTTDYEAIGLRPASRRLVRKHGKRAKLEFGRAGTSSLLRLHGRPSALSPTLVFGPVVRNFLRRARLRGLLGPPDRRFCPFPGPTELDLYRLEDHAPKIRKALLAAFGSPAGFASRGTGTVDGDPYVNSLGVILSSRIDGKYGRDGALVPRVAAGSEGRIFTSELLPWLGELPGEGGPERTAQEHLWTGALEAPALFDGALDGGLHAFLQALQAKSTYAVQPRLVAQELLRDGRLTVPGVVFVPNTKPVSLGEVKEVVRGGILFFAGPVNLTGNISRGEGAEPLTIVSMSGDLRIEEGVRRVEAYLVAATGKVLFPTGDLELVGGLATYGLDLDALRDHPANRQVRYAQDLDPAAPESAEKGLRIFLGTGRSGDERVPLAVLGGGGG